MIPHMLHCVIAYNINYDRMCLIVLYLFIRTNFILCLYLYQTENLSLTPAKI